MQRNFESLKQLITIIDLKLFLLVELDQFVEQHFIWFNQKDKEGLEFVCNLKELNGKVLVFGFFHVFKFKASKEIFIRGQVGHSLEIIGKCMIRKIRRFREIKHCLSGSRAIFSGKSREFSFFMS